MGCSVSLLGQNLNTSVVLSTSSSPYEFNGSGEISIQRYPSQRSAIKKRIKNQFFNSFIHTGSSRLVKNQEPPSKTSIEASCTSKKSGRNLTGKSNTSVKHHVSSELGSCDNYENKRTMSDFQSYGGRITTSFNKLSVHEQENLPRNPTSEISVVYISDFNSNLSELDSFNQENGDIYINGLIRRELPTPSFMQDHDAVVGHEPIRDFPLSLESGEIALAVHQDFFNDFGDICDDDFSG